MGYHQLYTKYVTNDTMFSDLLSWNSLKSPYNTFKTIEKYCLNKIILVSRFHSALIFMFESFFDVTISSHGQFAEFLINFRYTNILDLAFDLGMLAVIRVDTSVAFLIKNPIPKSSFFHAPIHLNCKQKA